jgi:hypothetical protein
VGWITDTQNDIVQQLNAGEYDGYNSHNETKYAYFSALAEVHGNPTNLYETGYISGYKKWDLEQKKKAAGIT